MTIKIIYYPIFKTIVNKNNYIMKIRVVAI